MSIRSNSKNRSMRSTSRGNSEHLFGITAMMPNLNLKQSARVDKIDAH